jgi:hypothetical protein
LYDSTVPDNDDLTPKRSRFQRQGRKPSLVPREVVFGIDQTERKVSLFGVALALVISLFSLFSWIKKSPVITTQKYVKGKTCPSAFHKHVGDFCEHILKASDSYWATRFLFIFVVALLVLFFTLRRKRAGVACFSVFLGIGLGVAGVVFVFLGAWLIVRAFRLQRYGEASWSGSNRAAKEMAQAKKEGRSPTPKSSAAAVAPAPGPVAPPTASKRYTPKQKPRKR